MEDGEKKKSFVIQIPSYEEVMESSQSKTTSLFPSSSSSLVNPTPSSFSQAFKFVKESEFYSPPPPTSHPSSRPVNSSDVTASPSSSAPSSSTNRNAILVSNRQKGNPLLKHIRNVRWAFADIVCDYLLGPNTCALYLSLRYHLLHPDYLYFRIRELQKNFRLRIVLCHVDVEDVVKPLLEVTRTSLLHDCTLLCGWSLEECGRYLETVKVYENKPADLIQGQMDGDYLSRLNHALTAIRHVNKTDVVTLGSTFGSLSHVMDASMEDLARCPGIGERKVKRLYDAFHEPFKREVPKRQCIPETSVANEPHPGSSSGKEDEKEIGDASNCEKKEPEVTVKSALSAAFAKYPHKVARMKNKSQEKEDGKSSANEEANPGDMNDDSKEG
ncbi:DNA excision repair protein ERCC-1 [Capsicum annuum]|uniref:DNA excision repair protein ERCC-1 n=1 Tax=Capsicum annuum TaxID=4072 RepID=A0A2G3A240_CAPAN|nr:DNA excision repair protein ERCC-1 [Capsicum annuum]PHT88282.1 DNA excision repair protein ERCC-1 [Capsicum annuum]